MPSNKPTKLERIAFGKRLAEAREAKGWTQKQLAAACGVSDGMVVSKWENGVNSPSDRAPWILCQVFGYEAWIRMWGDEPSDPQMVTPDGTLLGRGSAADRATRAAELLSRIADELAERKIV